MTDRPALTGILFEEGLDFALDHPDVVARAELSRDRVHHRFRFPHELRKMLRDDMVGFARRIPGRELILMHVADVGQQFEQGFIELLVVELIDETRICLSDGIVKGASPSADS